MRRLFLTENRERRGKTRVLPLLFVLLLLLSACGRQAAAPETPGAVEAAAAQETAEPPASVEPALSETERAERERSAAEARQERQLQVTLNNLTREEKVGQLFFVQCPAADAAEKIAQYHLGGVLLFTRDYQDANGNWLSEDAFVSKLDAFQSAAREDTGIPLFIGSDEEGGTVTRASRNPNLFPAKLPSPQALYKAGGMTGLLTETLQYNDRLRALGINVNFAPVCDVSADPKDFIYERSFGQDAEATAEYVAQTVGVMNDAGMGSVLKHFPGYGNNVDTHTGIALDERPYEQFETSDFLPFRAGIEAGADFVLVSHNIVTCMDETLPASLSGAVHAVLREDLDFDGVVLTDDLSMDAVQAYADDGSVAVLALLAGNDMIVTADFETQIAQVLSAIEDGTLDERVIDEACARVLRAKAARFAMPWQKEDAA